MDDSELLSSAEWTQIVECRLGTSDFEILSCKVKRILVSGGFLGEHSFGEVCVRRREEKRSTVLHFFIKREPKFSASQMDMVERIDAFPKEVGAVSVLFGKLRSALKASGEKMEWTCKCYYTRPGLLVFDDLSKQGFRSFILRDPLSYEHFALAMKTLANMHAASLIFEETQPIQPYRLNNIYSDILRENFFSLTSKFSGATWLLCCVKAVWTLIELIRGKEDYLRMKSKVEEVMNHLYELQQPSQRFRNVVCHGDIKRENIMFLHEENEPVEARVVDFQLVRYAPPANDVMCFLYMSTDREVRDKYGSQLLATYHKHLSYNLTQNGLNVEEILSWKEFKKSCDVYKTLGIVIALCYTPVTFMKEEFFSYVFNSSEVFQRFAMDDRSAEIINAYNSDENYRKNISVVIEEFIEECVEKRLA